MAHVNSTGLSAYKGSHAPRNAFNSPWYSRLDLRITQDIGVFARRLKATLGEVEKDRIRNTISN